MHTTSLSAAGALIAATLVLTGCGAKNPITDAVDNAVNNAVENAVENAIENETGSDVDFDFGGQSLPDNFPSELPTIEATLATTLFVDDTFALTYDAVEAAQFEQLRSELEAAGFGTVFDAQEGAGSTTMTMWIGTNGTWRVTLNHQVNDEGKILLYTVSPDNS